MTAPDPATLQAALQALHEIGRLRSIEPAFKNPVLLAPAWHPHLLALEDTPATAQRLEQLQSLAERLRQEPWPFGMGPLDALFMTVKDGESALAHALEQAAAPEMSCRLSADYIARMAKIAEGLGRKGEWRDAVMLGRLVLAAVDARQGRLDFEQPEMAYAATVHWLDVVTRAVSDVPDPRLFHDARTRGEKLAGVIHDPRGFGDPADMLFGLGVLHLDPYVGGRSSTQYPAQIAMWLGRFRVEIAGENDALDREQAPMPEPADALERAAHWLEQAASHRSGPALGRALKAQMQALVWARLLEGQSERTQVLQVGARALQVLQASGQQSMHTEVTRLLDLYRNLEGLPPQADGPATDGVAVLPEIAAQLLARPLPAQLQGKQAQETLDHYLQTAFALRASAPAASFRLWTHVQPLGRHLGVEHRWQFFQQGLLLLHGAWAPVPPPADAAGLMAAFERLRAHPAPDPWEQTARLLALALHSSAMDEEEEALAIVDAAGQHDAAFANSCPELLPQARASLLLGASVNRYNRDEFGEAAALYLRAATAFLDCGDASRAMELVERAVDIALNKQSLPAQQHFIATMPLIAPRLELATPGAAEHLQVLYRQVLAALTVSGGMTLVLLQLFLLLAKGATFAQALLKGGPRDWLTSDEAREMEAQIAELQAECAALPPEPTEALDYDTVLTSFVGVHERKGGGTPVERMNNLRIAFEAQLEAAQRGREPAQDWIVSETALQQSLGEKSALLSLYFGQDAAGGTCVFLLLLTRDQTFLACGELQDWNSNLIKMSLGGQQVSMSPFALGVAALRQAVQEDPLNRAVSSRAAGLLLAEQQHMLGGGILQALQQLRAAGTDHLYIWPHGPYHVAPFHLFGPENQPLAQDWTVTYLPNLHLLDPARERWRKQARQQTQGCIAIGLDFPENNARGLSAITDAESEAMDIAVVMQASNVLTGRAVSKAAVLRALQTHGRVHIATHGDLPVSTAAFQCLYLGTAADGHVLHAHEIQRLDLRGVDLVTMSACETALGRFDISDNLRGLPASLLAAGVATIVGTLWPVETTCARHFFVRFYTELSEQASKGDAFRQAQLSSRRVFPQYRDWGAFYLSGDVG